MLAALLVVMPVADFVNNVWPFHPRSMAWRYASEGLLSESLLSMALGMLLASAVAFGRRDRRATRLLSLLGWLLVAGSLVGAVDFGLNAVQLSGGVVHDPAARWTYNFGAIRVTAKYLLCAVFFALIGLSAPRRVRRPRRHLVLPVDRADDVEVGP